MESRPATDYVKKCEDGGITISARHACSSSTGLLHPSPGHWEIQASLFSFAFRVKIPSTCKNVF